jgi:hypothetical protein
MQYIRAKENKYEEGDVVYARAYPTIKLIIRRYVARIYYCKIAETPQKKDLVYFERELMTNTAGIL